MAFDLTRQGSRTEGRCSPTIPGYPGLFESDLAYFCLRPQPLAPEVTTGMRHTMEAYHASRYRILTRITEWP